MFKSSKRLVAMLICLAMVLSMLPMSVFAAGTTIYVQPNENWLKDGARFAAYFFGAGETWVDCVDAGDGLYSVEVPAGYPSVIFCRMNPNNAANNWDNKWSQTDNLTVPTDDKVVWVVDGWGQGAGQWIAKGGEVVPVEKVYYIRGDMNNWGLTNPMTKNDDGTWSVTINLAAGTYNYKASDAGWGENWGVGGAGGDNISLTVATAGDYIFTLDTVAGTVTAVPAAAAECTHENTTTLTGKDATCTEAGLTEGEVCGDCGYVIVAQEEIPALGHTYGDDSVCDVCDFELKNINVYFQNNWMWSEVKIHIFGSSVVADTEWPGQAMELYGNDGNYDIYAAEIPSDAKIVITGIKDDGSGALDQSPDLANIVDGTCYYMTWEDGNAVGSENIEVILPSEPECEHEYEYDCSTECKLCGEETRPEAKHEYFYACDAYCMYCYELTNPDAAHNITHVDAVAGTDCQTWDGNVEYWTCSDCGGCWLDEALTMQTNRFGIVTNGAHSYFSDCDTVCELCGEETRPEASHNVVHVEAKAPTCYENGNIEYWYCEACGQAWLDADCTLNTNLLAVVLPAGHNYEGGICTECGDCEYDVKFQTNTDGTAIRLLSYVGDLSAYANVKFSVTINGNTTELVCTNAYKSLLAGGKQVAASDVFGENAEYFVMYTINNITEAEYANDMTITVIWTSVDGTETTSETRTVNIGELVA